MNPWGCSAVFEHVLLAETTAWRLGPLCFAFRGLVWGFLLRPWGLLILHVTPPSWLWLLSCSPTLSALCLSHLLLHIRKPDVNKWPHISNLFMKYSFYCFKIDWSLAHREKKKRKYFLQDFWWKVLIYPSSMDPGAGRSQHSSPFYCSLQNIALPLQLIFLLISKAKPAVLVAAVKWLENIKDIAHHQPLTALSLILIFIQDSEELTNLKSYFLSCME